MKSLKRKCGGCQHWTKWKNDKFGGGICELQDGRVSSGGKACDHWKAIPYKRVKPLKQEDIYVQV